MKASGRVGAGRGVNQRVINLLMLSRVGLVSALSALWLALWVIVLIAIGSVVLFASTAVDGFIGVPAHSLLLDIHVSGHAGTGWDHWTVKPPD